MEVARRFDALERLWVCSPDLDVLRPLRAEPSVKLVHSERRKAIAVPLERHAYELADIGIDAMNMHHSEWTAGLVSLFHRFDVQAFAWDTQEVRQLRAVLRMRDRRGLLRPARTHGRDDRRVDETERVT